MANQVTPQAKGGVGKIVAGILGAAVAIPVLGGLAIFAFATLGNDSDGGGDGPDTVATASAAPSESPEKNRTCVGRRGADDPTETSEAAKPEEASASPSPSAAAGSGDASSPTADATPAEQETAGVSDEDALLALHDGAARAEGTLPPDGSFIAQLSSKYPGVEDKSQTSADGDHVFSANDIVAEYQKLANQFGSDKVVVVRATHFGKQVDYPNLDDPNNMFVIFYNGGFKTREDAENWCSAEFPGKSGEDLNAVCYVREFVPPHSS